MASDVTIMISSYHALKAKALEAFVRSAGFPEIKISKEKAGSVLLVSKYEK